MSKLKEIQERLKKELIKYPSYIKKISPECLTQDICEDFINANNNYQYFENIPNKFKTQEMCEEVVNKMHANIYHVPVEFISPEMIKKLLIENFNFNDNFLKEALTKGTELNKKLSTEEKAALLYLNLGKGAICTEIDVFKRAWQIKIEEMTSTKNDVELYSNLEDLLFTEYSGDVALKYKNINNLEETIEEFLKKIKLSPNIEKEALAYIMGGDKGLEAYYEKINNEKNYIYTNKGKMLSDDLIEKILNGENIKILDEEFECTFYSNPIGYDFALVTLSNQNFLVYIYGEQIVGIANYDSDLMPETVYETDIDICIYDIVSAAALYRDGVEITGFDKEFYMNESKYQIGFSYNNKDYTVVIEYEMNKRNIYIEDCPFYIEDMSDSELIDNWMEYKDEFDIAIQEIKNFIETLKRETPNLEEI